MTPQQPPTGMMEWMPIDSAPTTHGAYLVRCPERQNTYIVVWRDDEGFGEPGWFHFAPCSTRLQEQPYYWMPLPAPPEPGK